MNLEELRKIAEAATAGEWVVGEPYDVQGALQCRCEGKGPLVWEGQANINGEMMLTHVHEPSESRKEIFSGDTSIYTKTVPHAYVVALSTSEYCEISKEDAEFIATFNPQKVLELLDRLEAVEKLHLRAPAEEGEEDECEECSFLAGGREPFPCDTIKAARGE